MRELIHCHPPPPHAPSFPAFVNKLPDYPGPRSDSFGNFWDKLAFALESACFYEFNVSQGFQNQKLFQRKPIPWSHGLINYTDTNAKYRHLKKFAYKGTSRQVFVCLISPPYTLFTYMYLFTQGSWVRENFRGTTVYKDGSKIPTWLNILFVQSIDSYKHLPQSLFTGQFF